MRAYNLILIGDEAEFRITVGDNYRFIGNKALYNEIVTVLEIDKTKHPHILVRFNKESNYLHVARDSKFTDGRSDKYYVYENDLR